MITLHFSITINAPKALVWDTMLQDETYRMWTNTFNEGSYYEGSWDEGSEIRFLGPGKDGAGLGGMLARIVKNRPHEFISIEHFGFIQDGKKDTESDLIKEWVGAHENYTFTDADDGRTTVSVDMDTTESEAEQFKELWPQALQALKSLCEEKAA